MINKATDEELMELYKDGSMKAFEKLYGRHRAKVYGYLGKRVKNRFDRDEIHQNVFLKLHRSRHSYNSSFPFLPWLFTVCRNVMIDYMRAKEAKEGKLVQDDGIIDNFAAEEKEAPGINLLTPAIAKLNEDQREAIRMRYGEDFSFDDIAIKLDTSAPNARKIVSRAVKKLRGLLGHKGQL
ncbi:MAG: sigma-70 family RNA polymerase sigma factor [bacterium]|nr:sigma-70 family RNA polymerase sigma factor [bacterium]